MNQLQPFLTAHLFPKIEASLLELLRTLTASDWTRPTVSPAWNVKDVAAHLLDTQLRKLSIARDGYLAEAPTIRSSADLVAFINRLNLEGVTVYRRLSPTVLINLMESASAESAAYHASLDPFAAALLPVSWAGEERSMNWFDTAREYTERWHHQQQIRLAVNRPGIMTPELYHPVLDCFMRALPYAYRAIHREPGTSAVFTIAGDCGGTWCLVREHDRWLLTDSPVSKDVTEIAFPQEIAWRVFTKGIDHASAAALTTVRGDSELGLHVLQMVSIVG
jgi:uncharacterized protein (TIGR03083 family)